MVREDFPKGSKKPGLTQRVGETERREISTSAGTETGKGTHGESRTTGLARPLVVDYG